MTPDLEEMIRHRAHEIWEEEGRPHGRHEAHWQSAAGEITQELERIKAAHTPATAEEIEAPAAPRRGRPRRTESAEPAAAPRKRRADKVASADSTAAADNLAGAEEVQKGAPGKRGRKGAGEAQSEAAPAEATTSRRRVAKGTTGGQSEPAAEGAPKTRRRRSQATETSSDTSTPERPARRGRKIKAESDAVG